MTDGRTDRRTDGGDCNIPDAFFKKSVGIMSYFMPGHQTLKFSYNFKRYNVNLMNKNQLEPKHFGAFICD